MLFVKPTTPHLLKPLLPYFIQERFKEKKREGKFQAHTMFVDLSGFTAMTETLMLKGNEGAEELSNMLNHIFEPLVEMVYQENGFIPYFAGDAFMAIFPQGESLVTADSFIRLSLEIRDFFDKKNFSEQFKIKAKIGLSYGDVEWGIVGKNQKSYYFRGHAVDNCATCQMHAKAQEVILDLSLHNRVRAESNGFWKLAPLKENWYVVENEYANYNKSQIVQHLKPIDEKVAQYFLPDEIINFNQSGEFRNVVTLFIAFEGVKNHNELDIFASYALEEAMNFSGYFKEIDYSDKGGLMVVVFGAPLAHENNTQRALEFAISLRQEAEKFSKLRFKIGATSGTAYTGIIGGKERCQYAAVGSQVNLAARLMASAKWGEIFCDQELNRSRYFRFSYEGNISYKGISKNIPTYQLLGRKSDEEFSYTNTMIGRQEELDKLLHIAAPILDGNFAGITYVYGEAGIGKSRLIFELRKALEAKGVADWLICQSDQILKKPFNPFIYCLKNYFEQSIDKSLKDNKLAFDENFELLLKECLNSTHLQSDAVIRELLRTKSILSGLLGIIEPNSLWEQLDAKGRYENTLTALANFFAAEAMLHSLVIILEDGHWYDEDSKRFLHFFIKNIQEFPVFILVTSRYGDDNSKNDLFLEENNISITHIDLNILQPEALQSMAEIRFGGKVEDDFLAFLQRSTNGNPFYIEQILEYFSENGLLEQTPEKVWTVKDPSLKLGGSMNAVLTARVDKLSYLVRETVKAAAVIGREFDLPILSEVMKKQEEFILRNGNQHILLKEQVQTAERSQIWRAMNELRYIFKHSLLREAIYDMQLRVRLRELHRAIAEAIEKLYAENIEERYADLAFHYDQAEITAKTIEYLYKAAEYAKRNFQNGQAISYYEKLLTYHPAEEELPEVLKITFKKGEILQLSGLWSEAEQDFQKALNIANQLNDEINITRAQGLLANVLILKGDYINAKKYHELALSNATKINDAVGLSRSFGGLGNLYFRQGDYEKAENYFNNCLNKIKEVDERHVNPQIVANLGLTYMNQSRYDEGVECMLDQLRICEEKKDKQGRAIMHTNIGIVYFEQGNYDAAQHHYQQGLALSEELGSKFLMSIALGSLGSVYEKKGELKTAEELYIRDLQLTEQLGDKQGIAIALGLMGSLHTQLGEFDKALDFIQRNLNLCEELGYQKGVIKALNLLGDVHSYTKNYDFAVKYYEKSMLIAKKINAKLLYGLSAVELAMVFISLGEHKKAVKLEQEIAEIVIAVPNRQLIFEHQILKSNCLAVEKKTKVAIELLKNMLNQEELYPEEASIVYFELVKNNPTDDNLRQETTTLHIERYRLTGQYLYLNRLNKLRK